MACNNSPLDNAHDGCTSRRCHVVVHCLGGYWCTPSPMRMSQTAKVSHHCCFPMQLSTNGQLYERGWYHGAMVYDAEITPCKRQRSNQMTTKLIHRRHGLWRRSVLPRRRWSWRRAKGQKREYFFRGLNVIFLYKGLKCKKNGWYVRVLILPLKAQSQGGQQDAPSTQFKHNYRG
jgi:hypothetical protein